MDHTRCIYRISILSKCSTFDSLAYFVTSKIFWLYFKDTCYSLLSIYLVFVLKWVKNCCMPYLYSISDTKGSFYQSDRRQVDRGQCDYIGQFLKVLGNKFSYESSLNVCWLFESYWMHLFSCIYCSGYFGQILDNFGLHYISASGHTDRSQRDRNLKNLSYKNTNEKERTRWRSYGRWQRVRPQSWGKSRRKKRRRRKRKKRLIIKSCKIGKMFIDFLLLSW